MHDGLSPVACTEGIPHSTGGSLRPGSGWGGGGAMGGLTVAFGPSILITWWYPRYPVFPCIRSGLIELSYRLRPGSRSGYHLQVHAIPCRACRRFQLTRFPWMGQTALLVIKAFVAWLSRSLELTGQLPGFFVSLIQKESRIQDAVDSLHHRTQAVGTPG